MENKIKIMIATKAFGMGIDKADIRFVYHINIPACLEDYFQEIGRAGRDGKDSNTFLFYTSKDLDIQKHMIDMSFPDKIILKRISSFINDLYNKEEEEEEEDRLEYKFIVCSIMNLFNLKDSYYIEKILELFIKNKIYILDESKTFIFKNKELTKKDLKKFYSYIKKEKLEHIYKLQKMVDYINLDTKSLKDKLYTNYFKIEDK